MKKYRIPHIFFMITLMVIIGLFLGGAKGHGQAEKATIEYYKQREIGASPEIKLKLQNLREEIRAKNYTFQVGFTGVMGYAIEQITGLVVPPNFPELIAKQKVIAEKLVERKLVEKISATCSASASEFDWRKANGATGVRDQKACGSCWDFATLGAFEGSYRIINKNTIINSSEQDILDCNPWGYNCNGGWWAHQYLIDSGVAKEADYPYTAVKSTCNTNVTRPYKAVSWGYVANGDVPSVANIKQALCQYGPLAIAVLVTSQFQSYTSGVFNACANPWGSLANYSEGDLVRPASGNIYLCITAGRSGSTEPSWPTPTASNPHPTVNDGTVTWECLGKVNHGVTLIGWDDAKGAWLIKNSWGTDWGETGGYGTERGYMCITYNCNNIGFGASWVQAKEKPSNCD
jgi:C1A family cysteine protease